MARQGLTAAFPYALFLNETVDAEGLLPGLFVTETASALPPDPPGPYTPTLRESLVPGLTPTFVSQTAARQANVGGAVLQEEFSANSYTLAAGSGDFALTGMSSALRHGYKITAAAGAFVYTGLAADPQPARRLVAGAGEFIYTLAAIQAALTASPGAFSFAGQDAELTYTAATLKLIAETGAFQLDGGQATFLWSRPFTASPGEFLLTGQDVAFRRPYRFVAEVGQFALTGMDAELIAPRIIAYPIFPKVITAGPS